MIYGYLPKHVLDEKHREAKSCRKKDEPVLGLLKKHEAKATESEIKTNGIIILKNLFELDDILDVKNDTLKSIDELKVSRIRDRSSETKDDIKEGKFKFFSDEELADPHFSIENKASVVSVSEPFKNIPSLYKLVFNEKIIAYAINYFDAVPLVSFAKVTSSFCNSLAESDTQWWHVDFGAKNILKAVVYLNDVDMSGGPFSYIKGSHKKKFRGWHLRSRFEKKELERVYDKKCFYPATANAGDCILAETSGFHKGEKPRGTNRLCLIFNFTLHPEVGFDWNKTIFPRSIFNKLTPLQRMVFSQEIFDLC